MTSRRDFLLATALGVVGSATGCSSRAANASVKTDSARLSARAGKPTESIAAGEHELPIAATRNGLLYVPRSYNSAQPAPLIVLLHGAGGRARNWFGSYGERAESLGAVMLAPESRGVSWDAIHGDFGVDIPFVDSALKFTFAHCAIDPKRVALAGFSDGATYALSLGLANGDLFTHLVAFSPGFVRDHPPVGKPPIFVSHGTRDQILPIEVTSRAIVPQLKRRGHAVQFVEFDGRHEVPPAISTQAWNWFLQ
jgi:phospholipase/carboxylesterase